MKTTALHLLITLIIGASMCHAQSTVTTPTSEPTDAWSELLKTAWAQFDANDFASALSTVNKVIALNPKSGNAAILHFLILNKTNPHGDPSADAARIIELAPSKEWVEQAYVSRGNYRLIREDYDGAIADLSAAAATNPSSEMAFHLRSFVYLMKGDLANTRADYDRSLQLDPSSPSAPVVRAFWLYQKGLFSRALADYELAIEWKRDYAEAFIDRGIVLGLSGDIDDAFESLKEGMRLKSEAVSDKTQNGIGRSPFWDLNAFVTTHPTNARGYEMRGLLRWLQKKKIEADDDFNKSIELNPALRPEIEKAARVFS